MNQTRELVTQKTTRIFYNIFHTFVTEKPAEQMFVSKLGFKFLMASKKVDITISKFRDEITVYSLAKIVLFSREKVTR